MSKHIITYSILSVIALVCFFWNIDIEFDGYSFQLTNIQVSIVSTWNAAEESKTITTIVSEKIPGATCVCVAAWAGGETGADWMWPPTPWIWEDACGNITTRKYKCTTGSGIVGFQVVFAKLIRFVVNMVLLLGVLAVVWLGIAWSFAGAEDVKAKSTLKTWAINIIIGLVILFLFRQILVFLAPWVYK